MQIFEVVTDADDSMRIELRTSIDVRLNARISDVLDRLERFRAATVTLSSSDEGLTAISSQLERLSEIVNRANSRFAAAQRIIATLGGGGGDAGLAARPSVLLGETAGRPDRLSPPHTEPPVVIPSDLGWPGNPKPDTLRFYRVFEATGVAEMARNGMKWFEIANRVALDVRAAGLKPTKGRAEEQLIKRYLDRREILVRQIFDRADVRGLVMNNAGASLIDRAVLPLTESVGIVLSSDISVRFTEYQRHAFSPRS